MKTTGRKRELIERVIKAREDWTETIEEREKREKQARETRAAEKLQSPSENRPDPKTLNNWTRDLSKLPPISYKEIVNYLVYGSCKFFQREDMKCFKQLKAFQFFKDGHMQKIELSIIMTQSTINMRLWKLLHISTATQSTTIHRSCYPLKLTGLCANQPVSTVSRRLVSLAGSWLPAPS